MSLRSRYTLYLFGTSLAAFARRVGRELLVDGSGPTHVRHEIAVASNQNGVPHPQASISLPRSKRHEVEELEVAGAQEIQDIQEQGMAGVPDVVETHFGDDDLDRRQRGACSRKRAELVPF